MNKSNHNLAYSLQISTADVRNKSMFKNNRFPHQKGIFNLASMVKCIYCHKYEKTSKFFPSHLLSDTKLKNFSPEPVIFYMYDRIYKITIT